MSGRRLLVNEGFHLADGVVVLAGNLEAGPERVGPGQWRLEIPGQEPKVLKATGEVIPNQRAPGSRGERHRAIAFEGPVDLASVREAKGRAVAIEI